MKCKLYADLKLLNSCKKLLKNLNIELLETSTPNVPKVVLREEIPLIKPVLYFSLASIPLSSDNILWINQMEGGIQPC